MAIRKEYKIGAVVALALAGLIWGVPFLKGTGIFSNKKRLYAIYARVDGVTPSNPVTINGLSIGQVEKLSIINNNTGSILMVMIVDGDICIPKNSIARIVSADLLGSKAIEIIFSKEPNCVEDGDTLKPAIEVGLLEDFNKQITPIREKAEHILTSVDSVMLVLQSVFNNKSKNNFTSSVQSIGSTIKNVEGITANLNSLIASEKERLADIFGNLQSISKNLKNNNDRINGAIQNIANITDSLAKSKLTATINNTNKTMEQLNGIVTRINSGKGSLGLLVKDDSLYNNLDHSAKDLDALLIDMKANPSRYLHFSVFGGGKKEKKNK